MVCLQQLPWRGKTWNPLLGLPLQQHLRFIYVAIQVQDSSRHVYGSCSVWSPVDRHAVFDDLTTPKHSLMFPYHMYCNIWSPRDWTLSFSSVYLLADNKPASTLNAILSLSPFKQILTETEKTTLFCRFFPFLPPQLAFSFSPDSSLCLLHLPEKFQFSRQLISPDVFDKSWGDCIVPNRKNFRVLSEFIS